LLHERDPGRCVVLLPGAHYSTRSPLLWFSRETAQREGWSVLEVLDEWRESHEPLEWARDRAERALSAVSAPSIVVVGKSLASGAANIVAERWLPAAWLTPLLNRAPVVEALARTRRPTLLVGSRADDTWKSAAIPENPDLEIVELDGLDHALQVEGDPLASLDALRTVTAVLSEFLRRLP
jgi:hypothetical protein